ncbi:protein disulfide isomerase-like 1-6 [Cucumis melo var. makuwa]|uniref:Protein disulfide isomerase-like 1-6 n=1 Tax=Cucumis melo var. makuwa TaxID=1194695 RepID=A0A5D3CM40_CUCMM|nr:protein disulfide isomerase-like 1-6 [Cucumis melo var. makuwa]
MEMMKEIKRKSRSTKRMGMKKMKLNKEIKRTSSRRLCSVRGSNHAKLLYKVAAFDNRIGSKFLLESDSSSSNIEEFARGLYDGTLSPYFISQLIPNNDGASIEIVVGRTFDELDLKNTNNVFFR